MAQVGAFGALVNGEPDLGGVVATSGDCGEGFNSGSGALARWSSSWCSPYWSYPLPDTCGHCVFAPADHCLVRMGPSPF